MSEQHTGGLGDAPIEPNLHDKMNVLAGAIDRVFNGETRGKDRKIGFVLISFELGEVLGRCNYISNSDRDSVVTMLKEQIKRFEGREDEVQGHG